MAGKIFSIVRVTDKSTLSAQRLKVNNFYTIIGCFFVWLLLFCSFFFFQFIKHGMLLMILASV